MSATIATPVATWDLVVPAVIRQPSPDTNFFTHEDKPKETDEEVSAFDDDPRRRVRMPDLSPGGKFRSVIKLFCRYENQTQDDHTKVIGKGWLIRPDLLVTAGHCVYDWNDHLGKVSEVKAYVGYHGHDTLDHPVVQLRMGIKVATTVPWLQSAENKNHDLGLIQLERPFTNVDFIHFDETMLTGTGNLGLFGSLRANPLAHYTRIFDTGVTLTTVSNVLPARLIGVRIVTVSSAPDHAGLSISITTGTESDELSEDGLMDLLRLVSKVARPIGQTILGAARIETLGPVGAVLAPIVHVAFSTASKVQTSSAVKDLLNDAGRSSIAYRAALAETALQTVLSIDLDQLAEARILANMRTFIGPRIGTTTKMAPALKNALLELALRISLDLLRDKQQELKRGASFTAGSPLPPPPGATSLAECFIGTPYEGFMRTFGDKIDDVFQNINGLFEPILVNSEDFANDKSPVPDFFDALAQRALVGEAALNALMECDGSLFSKTIATDENGEPESIIGKISKTFNALAPKVLDALPTIIRVVSQITGDGTASIQSPEEPTERSPGVSAVTESTTTSADPGSVPATTPRLKKRPSLLEYLDNSPPIAQRPVSLRGR